MRGSRRYETLAALSLIALSCGRAKVKQAQHFTATITEVTSVTDSVERAVVTISRSDCPSEQIRFAVPADTETGRCLKRLVVGQSVEFTDLEYQFPPMTCGKPTEKARDTLGNCFLDGAYRNQLSACSK